MLLYIDFIFVFYVTFLLVISWRFQLVLLPLHKQ